MRRVLGRPDDTVWWCQYGSDRAKPTDLWGELPPSFEGRTCSNGNDDCHHISAPRGSTSGTDDPTKTAEERAKIPFGLSKAILEAVEEPEPVQATLDEVPV